MAEEGNTDRYKTCPNCGASYLHLTILTCVCGKEICRFCKSSYSMQGGYCCSEKCSSQSAKIYLRAFRAESGEDEESEKQEESCCYITSACLDDLGLSRDSLEMKSMKTLTKEHILKSFSGKKEYVSYDKRAPAIVQAIRARADFRETWQAVYKTLREVASSVVSEKYEEAHQSYKNMVLGLENNFVKANV